MRILIVDDNERARTALKFLLGVRKDWEICGEASGGRQRIIKAIQLNPRSEFVSA
jgi:DNA-binding NarL/FixJ family response regulator